MAVGIGAAGIVGIAHESTPGTYTAPVHYLPVRSESINFMNEVQYTRPIMGVADQVHAVEGPQHVEGDLEFELIEDLYIYLMYGARASVNKTGTGPWVYTFTPTADAEPPNSTLSITIERNGQVFGYTGCVIGSQEITVDNGLAVCTMSVLGRAESNQSNPTPNWPTTTPYGADAYTLQVAATGITLADNFSWEVDDSAEAVYRLGNAQSAAYVKFGERTQTASLELDFEDLTKYNIFKNVTAERLQFDMDKDASNYVHLDTKLAVMSSYEVNLTGQGDLVRGSIEYESKYDFATSMAYLIEASSSTMDIV